jgi:hypothetical protein
MYQNKYTTFIQNNLVLTIIATLILGGGVSTLAFSVLNPSTKKLTQSNVADSSIEIQSSSSSLIKSNSSNSSIYISSTSSVSSSVKISSTISSSSVEELKKEVTKEIPKTVEVEKPKSIAVVDRVKITEPIKNNEVSKDIFVNDLILRFSRFDGTMSRCINDRVTLKDGLLEENLNSKYDCDVYYFENEPQTLNSALEQSFTGEIVITGKAKFQKRIGNFNKYSFNSDVKIEPATPQTKLFTNTILTFVSSTGSDENGFANIFATNGGDIVRIHNKFFDISKIGTNKLSFTGRANLLFESTYEFDSTYKYTLDLIS